MKQFFLLCVTTLFLSACNNTAGDSVTKNQIIATGSAGPAQLPPQNALTQAMMMNYWVFEFYVLNNDPEGSTFNRGRWYKFYPDGTYDGGHWRDQTDFGNWYYKITTEKTYVLIDSEVNDLNDAEWDVQASTRDFSAMSWVRSGKYGDQRIVSAKLLQLTSTPTKKQFLLE